MTRIAIIIITLALIASCSKPVNDGKPSTGLLIDLKQSVLNINQIDSADVVFRKVGTDTKVKQRFSKASQSLMASLQSLTPGTWNADVEVYTKTVNQLSNQYVIIKPILIEEDLNEVKIAGPGAAGWLKRNVKSSVDNEVVVIIPEDVYDSYFEIRSSSKEQLVVGIQREAININYMVRQENWACNNECLKEGRFSDINYFMPFTQTIMTKKWTRNELTLSVLNDKSEELLSYDRTWHQ